jgi:uncharacterized membrane protein YqjE
MSMAAGDVSDARAAGASGATTTSREVDPTLREESIGQLLTSLSEDFSTLVRQELRLAQAEMTDKGKAAGLGIGMFGGAGIVAFIGLGALTATVIALLATTMKVWLAALIVTVVVFALAGVLALIGKQQVSKATPPVPEETKETVQEDVQWAQTQLKSGRR